LFLFLACLSPVTGGCVTTEPAPTYRSVGTIHREGNALDGLVAPGTAIERLADGFQWSEGPVWVPQGSYLLLSDVPANKMYRWSERDGLSVFLEPSGYTGTEKGIFREPGSNGLIRGDGNSILLADHGNRAIARLDLSTRSKSFLATQFQGKKFNSPNDLVRASDGSIYFTDPPYGLEGLDQSPHKELPFNGVYRLLPSGEVELVDDRLTFPNGIILSPDERTLYVAVSDPKAAQIHAYSLDRSGRPTSRRLFADMTELARGGLPGLPDGMAIDAEGNLYATGPGGVHIFNPQGGRLGRIDTGTAVANCAFGEDGKTLFLASNHFLARVRTRVAGLGSGRGASTGIRR
jgi:gluconolactonase